MPQPGETITTGTIVRWLVGSGDSVKEGQNIVELETEKAVFEYESPYEGKLLEILAKNNSSVPVGDSIAVFEVEDKKAKTYLMLGLGGKPGSQPKETKTIVKQEAPQKVSSSKTPKLSPLIRKLMQEYHLDPHDLNKIGGSGPGGRITKENILKYLDSKKTEMITSAPYESSTDFELIACSPIRSRIAEHMVLSKKTIPHAHINLSIDVTRVVEIRNQLKDSFKKKNGVSLGYLPLIFPSLKKAILAYPLVNASFQDNPNAQAIKVYKKINLGIAVDTEKGLYIPVLKDAGSKNFVGFARDLEELLNRAKKNQLNVSELTGVTFTFNNYGFFGTEMGVQIILPPQSTTLGMGAIQKRPWVVPSSQSEREGATRAPKIEDEIKIRWISEFTLAFDHRVIDGRDAGLFLLELKKLLENAKILIA